MRDNFLIAAINAIKKLITQKQYFFTIKKNMTYLSCSTRLTS